MRSHERYGPTRRGGATEAAGPRARVQASASEFGPSATPRTDAERPDVRLRGVVPARRVADEHLGRGIHQRATLGMPQKGRILPDLVHHRGQPKVGDLDLILVVEQDVLGLQVAMVHVESVAVLDGLCHLNQVAARHVLLDLAALGNPIEELAATAKFLRSHTRSIIIISSARSAVSSPTERPWQAHARTMTM